MVGRGCTPPDSVRLVRALASFLAVSSLAAAVAVASVGGPSGAADIGTIAPGAGADAAVGATAPFVDMEVVTIFQTGSLTSTVRSAAISAATSVGSPSAVGRGFTAPLVRVRRGSTVVQQSLGSGWAFPMAITAFGVDVVRALMGRANSAPLAAGQVVMGQTSAALRGAQVGDLLDFRLATGATLTFVLGRIAPDIEVGGTEIVMSLDQATRLGASSDTSVVIFSPLDRTAIMSALQRNGLIGNSAVRVRTTWDPFDPDLTLSLARTKQLLGEFDIDYANLTSDGWTSINPTWLANNLPSARELYPTGVRARCHKTIAANLRSALTEINTSYPFLVNNSSNALASTTGIDVVNTNTYGGCSSGQARFSRSSSTIGSISRHSWGQAIDMSTVANCQGCIPKFDCRIVRVFRKFGFSWGGNYLRPDGMHFEWVGEARNNFAYPSTYCPNTVVASLGVASAPDARAVLFADHGWTDH